MDQAGGPRPRRASFDRDWTKGSIIGNLWGLAWPMTVSASVQMLGPTIDMIWVGASWERPQWPGWVLLAR